MKYYFKEMKRKIVLTFNVHTFSYKPNIKNVKQCIFSVILHFLKS